MGKVGEKSVAAQRLRYGLGRFMYAVAACCIVKYQLDSSQTLVLGPNTS